MNRTAEFVELLAGIAGLLDVVLNSRMLGISVPKKTA